MAGAMEKSKGIWCAGRKRPWAGLEEWESGCREGQTIRLSQTQMIKQVRNLLLIHFLIWGAETSTKFRHFGLHKDSIKKKSIKSKIMLWQVPKTKDYIFKLLVLSHQQSQRSLVYYHTRQESPHSWQAGISNILHLCKNHLSKSIIKITAD